MRLGAPAARPDVARSGATRHRTAAGAPGAARHRVLRRVAAGRGGERAAAALRRPVRGVSPVAGRLSHPASGAARLHPAAPAHARRRGGDQRALPEPPHGAGRHPARVARARQPRDHLRAGRGPRERRGHRRRDGARPRRGLRRRPARREPVGAGGGGAGRPPGGGRGAGALSHRTLRGARAPLPRRVGDARQPPGDRALREARFPAHPRLRGEAAQRHQRAAVYRPRGRRRGAQSLRPPDR